MATNMLVREAPLGGKQPQTLGNAPSVTASIGETIDRVQCRPIPQKEAFVGQVRNNDDDNQILQSPSFNVLLHGASPMVLDMQGTMPNVDDAQETTDNEIDHVIGSIGEICENMITQKQNNRESTLAYEVEAEKSVNVPTISDSHVGSTEEGNARPQRAK